MSDFKIFSGSGCGEFSGAVAEHLKIGLGRATIKKFSCGEKYVKFEESFRGQEVFLISTGRTGAMDSDLIELFLLVDAARQSFAERVHVVMPYFPYSRQDKIHAAREGISAKLFANLLARAGCDHLITLQFHSDQIQGFFDFPVDNLNPRRMFVEYFRGKNLENPVVVSPDAGGAKAAKRFADALGVGLAILHKDRPAHNQSEVSHVIGEVENCTPIIFDDIVDTAGSVCAAREALRAAGARDEAFLCATHAVFSGPAVERLEKADFAEIVVTDSLPVAGGLENLKVISATKLVAEVIRNVAAHRSVSGLYL